MISTQTSQFVLRFPVLFWKCVTFLLCQITCFTALVVSCQPANESPLCACLFIFACSNFPTVRRNTRLWQWARLMSQRALMSLRHWWRCLQTAVCTLTQFEAPLVLSSPKDVDSTISEQVQQEDNSLCFCRRNVLLNITDAQGGKLKIWKWIKAGLEQLYI